MSVGRERMAVDLVDYHVVESPRRQEKAWWGVKLLRGCHLVKVDDDFVVRVVRTETGLKERHRQHRVPN